MVWAESTWSSKRSQWKRYLDFCSLYNLSAVPASDQTGSLYITYLTDQVCFSTICNYVSSVWSLHSFLGEEPVAKGSFLVTCTLKGAKRLLGDVTLSATPLFPDELVEMYKLLDYKDLSDLVFWTATCLAYRCLLRKSHYTSSPHSIRVEDIEFTDYGLSLSIRSSKTIQYSERVLVIPVIAAPNSILCPVFWLKTYMSVCKVISGTLFMLPGKKPRKYTYSMYSKKLAYYVAKLGLAGTYSSHSLRRGSATFLSRIGLPLHDIKSYGDWKSLSVLLYLSNDHQTRLMKDVHVATAFSDYTV